jgi:hypothetical protein
MMRTLVIAISTEEQAEHLRLEAERVGAHVIPAQLQDAVEDVSVEDQIARQLAEGKNPNAVEELYGQWPGDETIEELLAMLTK